MKTCRTCRKRATCREICPEIEKQLPALGGRIPRAETGTNPRLKAGEIQILFDLRHALTAREKVVLYLYYLVALPTRTIADGLRMTVSGIHTTLGRIRQKAAVKPGQPGLIQRDCVKSDATNRRDAA